MQKSEFARTLFADGLILLNANNGLEYWRDVSFKITVKYVSRLTDIQAPSGPGYAQGKLLPGLGQRYR